MRISTPVNRLVRLSFLLIGVLVMAMLIRRAGASAIAGMLRRVGWSFLTITAIYLLQVALRAVALWRTMLDRLVPYRDVLAIRLIAETIEMLTFTGPLIAEPSKGWFLTYRGVDTPVAYGAALTEYLLYMVASAVLAAVALTWLLAHHVLPIVLERGTLLILVATAAFLAAFSYAAATGIGLIVPSLRTIGRWLRVRAIERAAVAFIPIEAVIMRFLRGPRTRLVEVMAIETTAQVLLVTEIWIIVAALGQPSSFHGSVIIEGGVKFVSIAFAFVPGQFGALESVYIVLGAAVGLPTTAALSVALVRRLRGLLVAAAGLVTWAVSPG
jgi:Lysylphosphatidylglycerol synthase TM region